MLHKFKKELAICVVNLLLCTRLLIFRPIDRQRLISTSDQIVFITVMYGLLLFVSTYFISLPKPEFSIYGITSLVTMIGFVAITVFAISKLISDELMRLDLINVIMEISFWFYLL